MIPLLTSLVVALGGLYLGWLVYRNVTAGAQDPVEKAMPGVHRLLKNKYYFDELYDAIFVRSATWMAETFSNWMDREVIDGVLHWVARISPMIGTFFREYIDKPIINEFIGDDIAEGVKWFGRTLRPIQTGRIQQYMIGALVTMAAFSVLFYYLHCS